MADGATAPFKTHILDFVPVKFDIDRDTVAAQRIMTVGEMGDVFELMKISRMLAVIENDVLI